MTVRYTLSWEEFFETQEESLPCPSIASFVATLFIAVAVGVFGGLLTYFIRPGDRVVASIFCWLAVGLFLLAFWDLKVRTRQRRKKATIELRSVYDRYYAGEQRFSFDQEIWTRELSSGKQESRWDSLLNAVETRNVFTLTAQSQHAIVPKRVLSSEQLRPLSDIAMGSTKNSWSFQLHFSCYLATQLLGLWRDSAFLMSLAHIAGFGFFLMIAYDMYGNKGPGVVWGWMIAGLFLFLVATTQFWYLLVKFRTSHKAIRRPWQSCFSESGLRVSGERAESFSAWKVFRKYRESGRCFLIYFKPTAYYIYPKRCLSAEQEVELRGLLATNLPSQ
jgi:hypothetical protein